MSKEHVSINVPTDGSISKMEISPNGTYLVAAICKDHKIQKIVRQNVEDIKEGKGIKKENEDAKEGIEIKESEDIEKKI